ncbi:MAG: hypothetical protein REI94_08425, partial [Moraxellaceae bacterium]|nr:hypothetical protein [Moraxellaceae bacterium]
MEQGMEQHLEQDGEVVVCACAVCGKAVPQLTVSAEVLDVVVGALEAGSPTLAGLELKERLPCPEAAAHAWVSHLLSCVAAWPTHAVDEEVLRSVDAAFADVARPEHFTNFTHCDECREHDNTLRARTRDTLQRQDLGTAGWDPISFCSAEGIGYFFPTLARFALLPAVWRDRDWYADQLLSHLAWEGAENGFLSWCA